jgi:hypothetical protein
MTKNEEVIEVHYKDYVLKIEGTTYNFGNDTFTDYRAYCVESGFVLDWTTRRLEDIIEEFKKTINRRVEGVIDKPRGYLADNGDIVYYDEYIKSSKRKKND